MHVNYGLQLRLDSHIHEKPMKLSYQQMVFQKFNKGIMQIELNLSLQG